MQSTSCVQRNDVCRLTEPSSICRESSACVPDPSIEASLFSLRGNPAPISASASSVPLLSFTDSCNTEASGHAFHPDHAPQNIAKSGNVVSHAKLEELLYQTTDVQFRQCINAHRPLARVVQSQHQSQYNVEQSHNPHIHTIYRNDAVPKVSPQSRQYRDLQLVNMMHHTAFSFKGLHAGMDIQSQLEILRTNEKLLLIQQWRDLWEEVRPPHDDWFSRRDATFAGEARRAHLMQYSERAQQTQYQTYLHIRNLHQQICQDSEYPY
ncbi:hypothetical protein BASA50_011038 [Batrachochytrium salamandrivorans]|uniref:Uncharacterized protein n=1 Tax=Batrachochytrium salamandrivorans TaxID=1357716 RepID=A0ABQ8EZE0_9FUNG|nr:hypothetical protein BASA50_011038 [Batrachochytrium salamandrivorans]KAJ1340130.1 hypothetical protein BSLG_005267 [Batrachochytrium salamandrivorans]